MRLFYLSPQVYFQEPFSMTSRIRRLGRSLSDLVAEDRDGFKRLDASSAPLYDDGSWLKPRR